ncbi:MULTISPECIES: YidC/Oxa1 family membrane protein insertase [unclassified Streptomyces]|uniref:YidC/Oxa1 family membrane protein insertase n=1 Tax=unclassified Streptomyces TaxID=2593676 RepID=UPI001BE7885C|nr:MULTISPECIES: YidC/Oxa1 family membrane protein insertase [unclassified Streptomyces]MBT2402639.1 YidC/Oxa1 family membrane protein insertase [Streptomyces sp. ISL-21]MBT2608032.1 YidC/Oxa1 family membrane protein insertase [Streptomyces sp. ISL-87]
MSVFVQLVAELGRLLEPALAESATAAAIVLFTVLVRLALHPLSRAAFRGATPVAGCLPVLLQLPVFFVMYRAFSSAEVGGAANELLGHRLFAAPLGARWTEALGAGGLLGAQGLVFLGLFAAIGAVAAWSAVRGRRAAAVAAIAAGAVAGSALGSAPRSAPGSARRSSRGSAPVSAAGSAGAAVTAEQQEVLRKLGGVLPLLSFGTLITAAVVPLAAGLYLLTTTAWSVAERAWLQYRKERAGAVADGGDGGARSSL